MTQAAWRVKNGVTTRTSAARQKFRLELFGDASADSGRLRIGFWRGAHAVAAGVALSLVFACGGGTSPAQNADQPPPLDDNSAQQAVPASSAKVKQGMDLIQAKKFGEARDVLQTAVAENPKDAQAAFYLGVAHENLAETPKAIEMYKKALELDPKLADASINLSALLLDAKDATGALKVVDNALKLAPKEKGLLTNRALALEATGNKDEAIKAYGAAVEAGGDDPQLRLAYAQLLAEAGRKEQALEQLRKLGPIDDPQLAAAAANTFGRLKAFADCVGVLDKAIAAKPAPDLLVRRGVCRMENGDSAGEKADYEAAIKLDPKFAPAYYYLGKHLLAKGDKKGAQANFEKAVETGGDTPPAKGAREELDKLKSGSKTATAPKSAPAPKTK